MLAAAAPKKMMPQMKAALNAAGSDAAFLKTFQQPALREEGMQKE